MTQPDTCPHCGVSLLGDPIPQESLDKGYYGPGTTHFRRDFGAEVDGVYDGVLYWVCPDCGGAWHQFDEGTRLHSLAEKYVTGAEQR